MADEYKINTRDVDDVSSVPDGAYYVPTDDIGAKAPASVVYATITADISGDDTVYHCDMTLAEILAAINAGSFVICRHGDVFSPLYGFSQEVVTFSDYYIYNGKLHVSSIDVAANDAITMTDMTFTADADPNDNNIEE